MIPSFSICTGFAWEGFGSGGATVVASVRSCQKLPPCPVDLMPAGSKMDLPLAKAEPISDGGSTSGITQLRRGKKTWATATADRAKSENSANTKVGEEGGGGGAPGMRAEIPLQPVEKIMVRQSVPLQPMEFHSGADFHLQPGQDPTPEHVDA